jgi:beta-barrel assembly-enhancing protease
MTNNGLKIRLFIGLIMAAVVFMKYYATEQVNPVTGEKQHVSMTPEQEVAMGLNSAPQMAQEFGGLSGDPKATQLVKRVGQKLVQGTNAGKSPYQFDFHLLADAQTINAFALPGGQIFITEALLSRLETEDQLAGVLGHEIGHVINRHSAEQIAKQELTSGLVGATQIAINPSSSQIAGFISNMVNMKYGREDELESDKYGVHYLHEVGYDPSGMIRVMEILKEAGGGNRQSEFMSTHPYPENRIAKIKEEIAKL